MKKRMTFYGALVTGMAFTVMAIVYLNSAQAQSVPVPPGSYDLTCSQVTFTGNPGQNQLTLSANCQMLNGNMQQTTLTYDIANCNGTLTWAPNGC